MSWKFRFVFDFRLHDRQLHVLSVPTLHSSSLWIDTIVWLKSGVAPSFAKSNKPPLYYPPPPPPKAKILEINNSPGDVIQNLQWKTLARTFLRDARQPEVDVLHSWAANLPIFSGRSSVYE